MTSDESDKRNAMLEEAVVDNKDVMNRMARIPEHLDNPDDDDKHIDRLENE